MAWNMVEVLVVSIWTLLLLGSVQGSWEVMKEDQPERSEHKLGFTEVDLNKPDDLGDYDDSEDEFEETETGATRNFDPSAEDASTDLLTPPRAFIEGSEVTVYCTDEGFEITLPDVSNWKPDEEAQPRCDLKVLTGLIFVPYTGCNVTQEIDDDVDGYTLVFWYPDEKGEQKILTVLCQEVPDGEGGPELDPRSGVKSVLESKDPHLESMVPHHRNHEESIVPHRPDHDPDSQVTHRPDYDPDLQVPDLQVPNPASTDPTKNCDIPKDEHVPCGHPGISPSECRRRGCCASYKFSCFYPMDECTSDKHFVFHIYHDSASIPVDPRKLIIPGTNCKPVMVNDQVAVFKFKVTECGVRVYTVDETDIYLAEVQTVVQTRNLKYGVISRSDPLRFLIECRYSKLDVHSLVSVSYMVKTTPLDVPTAIHAKGLYGVVLRMAKDETYSDFYPSYHLPLKHLLGKNVYLELRLQSPKPHAVLIVNYCIAYPRSATNALVLIYEGCPNPYDPEISISPVHDAQNNRHIRRFKVTTFQFMNTRTSQYLNEEIYFMCSSEVCWSSEKTCQQHCFNGKLTQVPVLPPKGT